MGRTVYQSQEETIRNLKVGDIVMVSTTGPLISSLVKRFTRSHWSHVALVFDVPEISGTEHDILLVEAQDSGIEVHRLYTYLRNPDRYELGFKRFDILTKEERERFRGFFLDAVDTPYDMRRLIGYFLQSLVLWAVGVNIHYKMAKKLINTQNYVCTTFAQRAFYLAVAPHKRSQVLFLSDDNTPNFLLQMEEIKPADVAMSKNAVWLYNEKY